MYSDPLYILVTVVTAYVVIAIVRKLFSTSASLKSKTQAKRSNVELQKNKFFDKLNKANENEKQVWTTITNMTLKDLVAGLRDLSLTPMQVLNAYQWKAVLATKQVNCVTEFVDEAEESAAKTSSTKGELYGIPVSVKEGFHMKGYDTTMGLSRYIDEPAVDDSVLVKTLKFQGAIPFVRTNIPQTMISFECSNPIYGATTNPLNNARIPGGSSGGEAALLKMNGSVLGIGSDIGGSLRIPAHMCGIFSLKPTSNRISGKGSRPSVPGVRGLLPCYGFMCRDVESIAIAMRAVLVPYMFDLDPTVVPLPFNDEMYGTDRKFRIGYYDDDGVYPATPGCQRAVHIAKDALERRGHTLEKFDFLADKGLEGFLLSIACLVPDGGETLARQWEGGEVVDTSLKSFYLQLLVPLWIKRVVSTLVFTMWPKLAKTIRAVTGAASSYEQQKLYAHREEYLDQFCEFWVKNKFDAVLCPGFVFPAIPRGGIASNITPAVSYTILYNLLDFPAGIVPVTAENAADQKLLDSYPAHDPMASRIKNATKGAIGMPIGVQCVALPYKEELCLRVMKELEYAVKT